MKPLSQVSVDEVRMRVLLNWARSCAVDMLTPQQIPKRHLWFQQPRLDIYEMRQGHPPSDTDRPIHLKGLRLELDPEQLPGNWRQVLCRGGLLDQKMEQALEEADDNSYPVDPDMLRVHIFARYAKKLFQDRHGTNALEGFDTEFRPPPPAKPERIVTPDDAEVAAFG